MNNQQVYKTISYYRVNHHFHEPYTLLLDGNFIKLLVEKNIDFKKKMENLLDARITFRVTTCILRELELLGEEFRLVLEGAKSMAKLIQCKHSLEVTVDHCLTEQLREQNSQQYSICTQDIQLRRNCRRLVNVPLFYFGPDQRITAEDINIAIAIKQEQQNIQKLLPKQNERPEIEKYEQEKLAKAKEDKKKQIQKVSSALGYKIKTKVPRGPNPLSVKRKKVKEEDPASQPQEDSAPQVKRKRVRKRNRNKNIQHEE